jgi:hypothetical protein
MRSWHDQAQIQTLDSQEVFKITGSEHTFLNLNTPEDFSAAEELAIKFDLLQRPPNDLEGKNL